MATSLINTECKRYGCMKNLLACYANCRYSTRCDDLRNEVINNTEQASSDINKYLGERGRSPIIIQLMKRGLKFIEAPPTDVRPGNHKQLLGAIKGSMTEAPRIKIKSIPRPAHAPAPASIPANLSTKGITKSRKRRPKLRVARLSKPKEAQVKATTVKLGKTKGASYLEKPPVVSGKRRVAKLKPQGRNTKKMLRREGGSAEKLATAITRKSDAMPRRPKNESSAIAIDKEQVLSMPAQEQEVSASNKAMMTRPARSKKRSGSAKGRSTERNSKVYIILEGKSASVVDEQGLMMHLFTNPSSGARYFEASEVQARVQIIKK